MNINEIELVCLFTTEYYHHLLQNKIYCNRLGNKITLAMTRFCQNNWITDYYNVLRVTQKLISSILFDIKIKSNQNAWKYNNYS